MISATSRRALFTEKLSNLSARGLLGRAVRLPLRLVPKGAVLTVRSGINSGMRWVAGSSIHGCWLGHYEAEKQEIVKRLVKPGMKVVDIGANAGFYTLAFSRLVGENGHVWAFEPLASNVANLQRHLHLNGLTNVTLIQAAVAEVSGIVGFTTDRSNAQNEICDADGAHRVRAVALGALLEANIIPVPDVIKMDVEGAESRVLQGARELLSHKKSALVIALHGWQQMQSCVALLNEAGYRIYRLDDRPFDARDGYVDEIYALPQTV